MAENKDSSVGARLRALYKRSGLPLRAIALGMGYEGPSSVQRYFDGTYVGEFLPVAIARKLVPVLTGKGAPPIKEEEVLLLAGLVTPKEELSNASPGPMLPPINSMPIDVPIRGTAVGGSNGDFSLNGDVVDYARRPPGILRNNSVFCIFVRGDSMEPRFDSGDLLYVNPARPAKVGDDVLVEMHPTAPGEPGPAYIKRLDGQTPTKLILRQFNPAKRIELPLAKVLRVSPIMRSTELLGI